MQEYISSSTFSKNNPVNDLKWINPHRSIKVSIEWFLSKLLFSGDISRVIYSTKEIAFRKRIELLDKGKNKDGILSPVTLDLPYAIYWRESDPEKDEIRMNAGQAVFGEYLPEFDRTLRAWAMKDTYKVILFYSRQDEVLEAMNLIAQEQLPEHPIFTYVPIKWRNKDLNYPVNITIESVNSNPSYDETQWLKEKRIFMVEVELTVRYYNLHINNVRKVIHLPIRFQQFIDTYEEDELEDEYVTEEVILNWASKKFNIDMDASKIDKNDPEYKELEKHYFLPQDTSDGGVAKQGAIYPNEYTTDIIKDYFDGYAPCFLETYFYDEEASSPFEANIKYSIAADQLENLSSIEFYIPTKETLIITDKSLTEITVKDLQPNSEYKCTIKVRTTADYVHVYYLSFRTKNDDSNKAPQPGKINFKSGLVGMHS